MGTGAAFRRKCLLSALFSAALFLLSPAADADEEADRRAAARRARLEPTRFPHWCRDLGMRWCMTDNHAPRDSSTVVSRLAGEDPARFLPPALAEHVRACERARVRFDLRGLQRCRETRPLGPERRNDRGETFVRQELSSLVIIPVDTVPQARLPASGARVVVDCGGRQLQVRGDLAWPLQLQLLRTAFDQIHQISSAEVLPRYGTRGSLVEAVSCDLESGSGDELTELARRRRLARLRRRATVSVWNLNRRGDDSVYESGRAASIPRDYVSTSCFDAAGPSTADAITAPTPAETARRLLDWLDEPDSVRRSALAACLRRGRSYSDCYNDPALPAVDRDEVDRRNLLLAERLAGDRALRAAMLEQTRSLLDAYKEEHSRLCGHGHESDVACHVFEVERGHHNHELSSVTSSAYNEGMAIFEEYTDAGCHGPAATSAACFRLDSEMSRYERLITDHRCIVDDNCENPFHFGETGGEAAAPAATGGE